MCYTAYYLIEPAPSLYERLNHLKNEDLDGLLLDPEVFSNEEAERSAWSEKERASTIKLLFLAQIKQYEPLSSDSNFEEIFGSARLSLQLFDQWWTIRRFTVSDNAKSLHPFLNQFIHLVDQTDSPLVNDWLEGIGKQGKKS